MPVHGVWMSEIWKCRKKFRRKFRRKEVWRQVVRKDVWRKEAWREKVRKEICKEKGCLEGRKKGRNHGGRNFASLYEGSLQRRKFGCLEGGLEERKFESLQGWEVWRKVVRKFEGKRNEGRKEGNVEKEILQVWMKEVWKEESLNIYNEGCLEGDLEGRRFECLRCGRTFGSLEGRLK